MKTYKPLSPVLALLVAVLAFTAVPHVGAQQSPSNDGRLLPGDVVITSFTGDVKIVTKNKPDGMAPAVGKIIKQGARILTGAESEVLLAFSNGTSVQVGANSKFFIDQYLQAPWEFEAGVWKGAEREPTKSKLVIGLDEGDLVADVKKLNRNSVMNVVTPLGTAGIRGTRFRISVTPPSTPGAPPVVALAVTEGGVDFTPAEGGSPTNVSAGNKGTFTEGRNEAGEQTGPIEALTQPIDVEETGDINRVVARLENASEVASQALANAANNQLDPTDQGDAQEGEGEQEATGGVDTPEVITPPVVPPPPPTPTPVPSNP